jgi:hypothetical protein
VLENKKKKMYNDSFSRKLKAINILKGILWNKHFNQTKGKGKKRTGSGKEWAQKAAERL